MLELFLNPVNMMVGGALISSPIIIHLINRMRYKRVRWAAMEFLLKSQKRNRRRLIIEQMILLALRILLVLLAGLLLARFLGFSFAGLFQPKNTTHVVVFDDRLSTSDTWRTEEGDTKNAFQIGKQLLEKELAKTIAAARTPQRLVVFRLSEPARVFELPRVNEDAVRDLGSELAKWEGPTLLHLDLLKGVETAREILGKCTQDQRYLHVISDFRQQHWREPEANGIIKALDNLAQEKVKIHLLDAAHPFRGEYQKVTPYHDNMAVVELHAETRVVAQDTQVQFMVTVANYSASERKNVRVTVKVDGVERPEGSLTIQSVPPGHKEAAFQVLFVKPGHSEITAQLENEEAGLQADNIRYATVEVKRQVPVLLVDGDPNGDKPGGDTFHIRSVLTAAKGYDVVRRAASELELPSLNQYPCVYLLNVSRFTDKAQKNLERYVREGGSVAFFLGDKVDARYYNASLYANGNGIFPAPLGDQPTPALSEDERQEKREQSNREPNYQIFIRDSSHPIFSEIYKYRYVFMNVDIDRYFPVPRNKWNKEPGKVEELVTLPNERPVAGFQASAQELLDSLPINDAQYVKYRSALEKHRRAVRDTLTGKSLASLAAALDALLHDDGKGTDDKKAAKPDEKKTDDTQDANLIEFWEQTDPKIQALRKRVEKFQETVQYGDPLVVAGRYGRGRTVAFLTTAGRAWNDWAGGSLAQITYPLLVLDLQKYLIGVDKEANPTVGSALEIEAESGRYDSKMHCYLQQGPRERDPGKPADKTAGLKDLGEELGILSGERLTFRFDKAAIPGVYHFELKQRGAEVGVEPKTEMRAYAFNVDTDNESDLRRAGRDELEKVGRLHSPGDPGIANLIDRQTDLSESAWLYLLFLLILVAEQAMAVHLSFHLRGNEAQLPAQAVKPQATAA